MASWRDVAEEFYPDESFEQPVDLYFRMTSEMVDQTTDVQVENPLFNFNEDQIGTARSNALGSLVTSNATEAYAQDQVNNDHGNLDRLVDYHRRTRDEGEDAIEELTAVAEFEVSGDSFADLGLSSDVTSLVAACLLRRGRGSGRKVEIKLSDGRASIIEPAIQRLITEGVRSGDSVAVCRVLNYVIKQAQ